MPDISTRRPPSETTPAGFMLQAQRCRRLADSVSDSHTIEALKQMAAEYEAKALAMTGA